MREIRVTGGGQQSALWNQIKADALQTPVVQVSRGEGAPLGGRCWPGYGVGLIARSRRRARGAGSRPRTGVRTRPPLAAHYGARLDRYRRLLDASSIGPQP